MVFRRAYSDKRTTAAAAVAGLRPGSTVYLSGNAATPRALCAAVVERAPELTGLRVGHVLLLGDDPFAEAKARGDIRHLSWFVGPADRAAVREGRADYVPCHLSEIPVLLRAGRPPLAAALLSASPPDRHGFLSLGVEVLASLAAAEAAQTVIVQVNQRMPRVLGNSYLHISQVDAIVEHDEELPELLAPPVTDVERRIAEYVVRLIPEHATLQLGIGGIPNAVMALLAGREDLGVHSEMISDSVMHAVEQGVVTGRYKTRHKRKVVTTFALGSRALYDWLHENPAVEAHPCDYTNDLTCAAQNDRLVAINSALSVDLSGQVNADSIGPHIYSGVGGQADFVRAAARATEGVALIALPSTARNGTLSRIVPTLQPGAGVVTSRADVRWVVTEHGAVDLFGMSLAERAAALCSIADPQFRAALQDAAPWRR